MIRPVPVLCALAALLASGCGAGRVEPPDPSIPFTTGGTAVREYPAVGVRFTAPADWPFTAGQAPLVASTSSGSATIAVWRYPRTEPLPRERAALDAARTALEEAARTRDASFALQRSRRVRVDGAPGIEVVGTERVGGRERRVRSTHVYAKGAELVVDAYAAERDFPVVDRAIFRALVRSLKIDPPRT